jgi:hypothetical protein
MMVMTKKSSLTAALAVFLIAVSALAGCAFDNGEGLPTLERERTAADVLPAELASQLEGDVKSTIDPDTVRLAGDYKGAQFYIARANDERLVCLVIVVDAEKWVSGCNASRGVELSSQGGYSVRLTRDGVLPDNEYGEGEDGWVALTDDVLVHKTSVNRDTGPQG